MREKIYFLRREKKPPLGKWDVGRKQTALFRALCPILFRSANGRLRIHRTGKDQVIINS